MIARLIEKLQKAGLILSDKDLASFTEAESLLSAEDIADAIWLALQMGADESPVVGDNPDSSGQDASSVIIEDVDADLPKLPQPFVPAYLPEPSPSTADTAEVQPESGLPIQVQTAPALQDRLSIARSLRPLMRKVCSQTRQVLDEAATVDRIAEREIWLPVLKPAPERWLDLEVVIEASEFSFIWDATLMEFRQILERQGAFRNVRTWWLEGTQRGNLNLVSKKPQTPELQERPRSPRELIDPTGRRLVLLVSDCRSSVWESGDIQELLKLWSTHGATAVVQLLPERLWNQSELDVGVGVQVSALIPGAPGHKLKIHQRSGRREIEPSDTLTVPIVTLTAKSLKQWALVVAAVGRQRTPARWFDLTWVQDRERDRTEFVVVPKSPEARIELFEATASPIAQQLASMMAAVPVSLPVVHLIQKHLLPEAKPIHVAEVYDSKLLERNIKKTPGESIEYDFAPEVRRLLIERTPIDETTTVLDTLSQAIAQRLNLPPIKSFTALLSPKSDWSKETKAAILPFAQVATQVLHSLGGDYASLAELVEAELVEAELVEAELVEAELVEQDAQQKSDISFWRPVYQLFKPEQPLIKEELRDFYVRRENSPVDSLVQLLAIEDAATKFLLAGHQGGGNTTELRRLEQWCAADYTVVWVDTYTALDNFNTGYAEVVVLIGITIVTRLEELGWKLPPKLEQDLLESLAKVTYQDKVTGVGQLELPKLFKDLGMFLKVGFQRETTKTRQVRPALSDIIGKVNGIIAEAEADKPKLLVIVDGLNRKDYASALEIFSSSLLTDLNCHIVYAIPISLRYSLAFREPMQSFEKCLELANIPVFKCDAKTCPTAEPDRVGRHILATVVEKRLGKLGDTYKNLFQPDALELLCEKSGGVLRHLVRLARTACEVALWKKTNQVDLTIAQEVIWEDHKTYSINDYHFSELDTVHRTGQLTTNSFDSPRHGKIVICDELLRYKLVLGYKDPEHGRWFDINPILLDDLERWRAANPQATNT